VDDLVLDLAMIREEELTQHYLGFKLERDTTLSSLPTR